MDINEIIRQVTEEICSKYGAQTQTPAPFQPAFSMFSTKVFSRSWGVSP